jgi:hypothetical protein
VEREMGAPGTEYSKEKSIGRIAAVDEEELAFDQPSGARHFIALQNTRRRNLAQLFLQILGQL